MDDPVSRSPAGSDTPPTTVVVTASPPVPAGPGPVAFLRADGRDTAQIVLRQTDPEHFELVEGFEYVGAGGRWRVTPADLPETDLASIPLFLSWFVSRYGAHTLAALLHDHLVRNGPTLDPPVSRMEADEVFLRALTELEVPFLRSRIMWTAVTFATRWWSRGWRRAGLAVWMVLVAVGIVALVGGLATLDPVLVGAAVLAPVPASLLWGWRQRSAGLMAGYTLWLVALPAGMNLAVYSLYSLAERVIRLVRIRRTGPKAQVAPPPRYRAR